MVSAQTLSLVRVISFGIGGLISLAFAVATLLDFNPSPLPHWLPIATAVVIAIIYFLAAALAGPHNMRAALDESHTEDARLAATLGFWTALATGTALWLLNLGGTLQLAITLTTASAVFFLAHVVLEVRGLR